MKIGFGAFFTDESRELALICDAAGVVVEADERARRALGVTAGEPLSRYVAPGTETKLNELLQRAAREAQHGWDVPMMCKGKPCSYLLDARRLDSHIAILAARLPPAYDRSIQQLNEAMQEVVSLNREIAKHRAELERAYRDLDESHRGVLTLHGELEDKAATLKRTSDVKSRVVANISHEFRTPLHSILGLSKLLLDGVDGPLSNEQQKQVRFIRSSAEELSEMVTQMLDLSRAEFGKIQLRPEELNLADFMGGMRGMLKPLSTPNPDVALIFDEVPPNLVVNTDQGKVAQILRNLVSNALKFTEHGEVRVSTVVRDDDIVFTVADTGIGIAEDSHQFVFEEFGQIPSPLQDKVKGSGLGLALSRRLAVLLGGTLTLTSEVGKGSTFTLTIPKVHAEARELSRLLERPIDPAMAQVLVLEDDRKTIFIYEKYLAMAGFQVVPARTVDDARRLLKTMRPGAIVLDIMLDGETSWKFLSEVKSDPRTSDIPTLVVTVTGQQQKARALGADEFWLKPIDQDRLVRKLKSLAKPGIETRLLVIDDDEKFLYYTRKLLDQTQVTMSEATNGPDGVRLAQELRPNVIFLDFLLRDVTAFDVLDELKSDPRTRSIPVIVVTSHLLEPQDRDRLSRDTESIISKEHLSRELAINRIRDALRKAGVGRMQEHQ